MREQQPAHRLLVLEQVKALDNGREQVRLAGVGDGGGVLDGPDDLRAVARSGAGVVEMRWRAERRHDWVPYGVI